MVRKLETCIMNGGIKMPMNPKAVAAVLKSAKTPPHLKAGLAKKYPKIAKQVGYKIK